MSIEADAQKHQANAAREAREAEAAKKATVAGAVEEAGDSEATEKAKLDKLISFAKSLKSGNFESSTFDSTINDYLGYIISNKQNPELESVLQSIKDYFRDNPDELLPNTIKKLLDSGIINNFNIFSAYEKSKVFSLFFLKLVVEQIKLFAHDPTKSNEKHTFTSSCLVNLLKKADSNKHPLSKKIIGMYSEEELSNLMYLWMGGNGTNGHPKDVHYLIDLCPLENEGNPFITALKKIKFISKEMLDNARLMNKKQPLVDDGFFVGYIKTFELEYIEYLVDFINTEATALAALERVTDAGSVEQLSGLVEKLKIDERQPIKTAIRTFCTKEKLKGVIEKAPEKLPLLFQESEISANEAFQFAVDKKQPLSVFQAICTRTENPPTKADIGAVLNLVAKRDRKTKIFDFIEQHNPNPSDLIRAYKLINKSILRSDPLCDIEHYLNISKAMEDSIQALTGSKLSFKKNDKQLKMIKIKNSFDELLETSPTSKNDLLKLINEFYVAAHKTRGFFNFSGRNEMERFDSRSGICFDEMAHSAILSLLHNKGYELNLNTEFTTMQENLTEKYSSSSDSPMRKS